ncbi:MAG: GAF domain-containing protein [Polyangiaceae bacterium]|nr:GAF domain-containing protein [Polyangiaceae bacterium]
MGALTDLENLAGELSQDGRFSKFGLTRPDPDIIRLQEEGRSVLVLLGAAMDTNRRLLKPYSRSLADFQARIIMLGAPTSVDVARAMELGVGALLRTDASTDELIVSVRQAFDFLAVKGRSKVRAQTVTRYRYELDEMIEIARALTTEHDIERLLDLILQKSRHITGADAGSMYIVEDSDEDGEKNRLRFKLSQNDSIGFDSAEFTMPLNQKSMAGYAACEKETVNIDDVYNLPSGSPYGFDRSFDERMKYRTKSVLCFPLVSSQGDVMGVLQLINKKLTPQVKLTEPGDFERNVVPFDDGSERLLATLGAQAGIALENAILYDEIRKIFEGFVRASVDAIEARDPTTSGHSRRVAELTLGLANAVEREDSGEFKELSWKRGDLREIEYASLLHDFGKIGVREHILVKAKKLFPENLSAIRQRFDFVLRTIEAETLQRKLEVIESGGTRDQLESLDREMHERRAEIETTWATIEHANEPTVLAEGDFQRIEELGRSSYRSLTGESLPLLTAKEVTSLEIKRGSLTPEEFAEIRSHVEHTYRFLSAIPWGKSFSNVAAIAGAHHERLSGDGYPNQLPAEKIPIQSRMMSVSDIFDALTASDRPYKRAMPVPRALDILGYEVKDGHLDAELVRIFVAAEPWLKVTGALY